MNTQKHVFYGAEGRYVAEVDFDRVTAERDALQQRLNAVEEENDRLRVGLKFYAEREHYHFESGNWDTVSGEPLNILWNGDEPDMIEDGSVARAILFASKHLCRTCRGYGRYQDGDSGSDEDGRAPNIVECDCADYERMPEYRARSLENRS